MNIQKHLLKSFVNPLKNLIRKQLQIRNKNKLQILQAQMVINRNLFNLINSQKAKYLTTNRISFNFCTSNQNNNQKQKTKPLTAQQIPEQNLQVVCSQQKIQNQQVQVFHAKGTLSILDKVPGPKPQESGELYVLMFTCGQCNHRQIRSFTKNAYHKGVVLVRCEGCDKVHLVADNLGWFEDQPVNVQTLHKDKIKKVHDPAAISMFLQKAFGQEDQLLKHQNCSQEQPNHHQHGHGHKHQKVQGCCNHHQKCDKKENKQ